jgi:hypothetical protein
MNTLCVQNVGIFNDKGGGTYNNQSAVRGWNRLLEINIVLFTSALISTPRTGDSVLNAKCLYYLLKGKKCKTVPVLN